MKMEAIRYSGGIVKIPVSQQSTLDGEIPRIAVCLREKVDELYRAKQRIIELEDMLRAHVL